MRIYNTGFSAILNVRRSFIRNLDFVEDLWILEDSDPQQEV
jgi:hypothetical protein